jgi:glutaredoxin-related protein
MRCHTPLPSPLPNYTFQSYCPTCKDFVERLSDADVSFKEVQLDRYGAHVLLANVNMCEML